ncbi:MAG: hypothetical protein AAGG56_03325 [Pseudomonadota bacterium]
MLAFRIPASRTCLGNAIFLFNVATLTTVFASTGLADPPPALFEATELAFSNCAERGEDARILEGYDNIQDLNGDGLDDYIADFSRIICGDADVAVCEIEGCPIVVWLSAPAGSYRRVDLGASLGYQMLPPPGGMGLPRLQSLHPKVVCTDAGLDTSVCSRTWRFVGDTPISTSFTAPPPLRPEARPAHVPPPLDPSEAGWTLRQSADGSPVALGRGTGVIRSLGIFCLQSMPFLVLRFHEPPNTDQLEVTFEFASGPISVPALFEETAGGAYVIDLAPTRLAARLAGPYTSTTLRFEIEEPVLISLAGSTVSIRAALASCYDF